jgi:hypothetical protein
MSSEIRKVVRQIIAPMAVFVPCVALMAAAPAFAAPQNATRSSSRSQPPAAASSADPPQSNAGAAPIPSQLHQVLVVAAEKAVATVSPLKFAHVSPGANVETVLNNVPGFSSQTLGVGGFMVADQSFTLDGFNGDEVATTFDGVPDLNTFLGGLEGQGDQMEGQAIDPIDLAGAHVYSGASTQAESSIDDLGGTVSFQPALPTETFHVSLGMTGGEYDGGGSEAQETFAINSGAISSLNGLNVLAKFQHTLVHGPWDNVVGRINSYYLAAVQPTSTGHVKLVALVNAENGQPPSYVPAPLLAKYGVDYNYPQNVSFENQETESKLVSLSVKSLMNPRMIGDFKAFYVGTDNDMRAWSNPIYDNNYDGYPNDMTDGQFTVKGCSGLNAFASSSPTSSPTGLPEVYDCQAATQQFGSPEAGSAYQRYIQNYSQIGAMGHLTVLLPDNTVKVGAMGLIASMLSEEGWYGSWPVPIGTSGYNMAWLEHDGQTWMQAYLQDNIRLLNGKLHIYPGVKYNRLAMFANDDQGYFYTYSGSITETYKWLEDSLGANYAFTQELSAYINLGQSTKAPNISALYGNIGAVQQPLPVTTQPEKVNNIDAGLRFKNARYYWDVAFFNRYFMNVFSRVYNSLTGITLTKNAGKALYRGGTVKAGVVLPYYLQLEGNAGYTHAIYTQNFSNTTGGEYTNGMPRANVPDFTGSAELIYSHGPWYGSVSEHYTGSEYVLNFNTGVTTNRKIGGYATLNLDGAYTWNIDTNSLKALSLELHVSNALNRRAPFYSPGLYTRSNPNFLWLIYNEPLFASLSIKASFF